MGRGVTEDDGGGTGVERGGAAGVMAGAERVERVIGWLSKVREGGTVVGAAVAVSVAVLGADIGSIMMSPPALSARHSRSARRKRRTGPPRLLLRQQLRPGLTAARQAGG